MWCLVSLVFGISMFRLWVGIFSFIILLVFSSVSGLLIKVLGEVCSM